MPSEFHAPLTQHSESHQLLRFAWIAQVHLSPLLQLAACSDVLESELEGHLKKCSRAREMHADRVCPRNAHSTQACRQGIQIPLHVTIMHSVLISCAIHGCLQAQPYFMEDVNAGSDTDPELPPPLDPHAGLDDWAEVEGPCKAQQPSVTGANAWVPALPPFERGRSKQRAALARRYGEARFISLVQRVRVRVRACTLACGKQHVPRSTTKYSDSSQRFGSACFVPASMPPA